MDRKKLCVCIPTYNRRDAIQKVLGTELDLFKQYGMDLMICDSSDNQEIETLVQAFRQKGASHLRYQKFRRDLSSNEKVFRIFRWAAGSGYSFIWLIHDHTICNEAAIQFLLQNLNSSVDFYLLNMQAGHYGCEEFRDIQEFLLKGAWRLNSFGASVINTRTFLGGVDWGRMWKKYGGPKTLNYAHIGFYFERAAEMEAVKVCQLFFERKDFLDFYRTKEISWSRDTLRICLECWGEVITRLPAVYSNKLEVMRTQDKWFLSKYSLLVYRKEQKYNLRIFLKYRKWMQLIYPEDYIRDFWISVLPVRAAFRWYAKALMENVSKTSQNGGQVYLFGAGRHAAECAAFFDSCRMKFDGFVVTSLEGNPRKLRGRPVYRAAEQLKGRKSLVVIAVLSSGVGSVTDTLAQLQDSSTVIETVTFAI